MAISIAFFIALAVFIVSLVAAFFNFRYVIFRAPNVGVALHFILTILAGISGWLSGILVIIWLVKVFLLNK
jgi:hypothetical protein